METWKEEKIRKIIEALQENEVEFDLEGVRSDLEKCNAALLNQTLKAFSQKN